MSTAPPPRPRRRPGWLAVAGSSAAVFLAVLALLFTRVAAGEDPGLTASASQAQVTTTTSDTTSDDATTSSDDATTSVPSTHAS